MGVDNYDNEKFVYVWYYISSGIANSIFVLFQAIGNKKYVLKNCVCKKNSIFVF